MSLHFASSISPFISAGEIERFSRQMMADGIGATGMERIRSGHVVCVGAGGLGSTIALYLAAAGVGKLTLVDFDEVEVSNLHRQVIHTTDRVGQLKVDSARLSCLAINPLADIHTISEAFSVANAERIVQDCDVVVDGSDNVAARYLVNDAAMGARKPLVSGSAMRWDGQLSVYGYNDGPCYRCLFPLPPPPAAVGSCNDTGVMGPVPGMIGCLQALETLKILAGVGETLSGRMMLFSGLRMTMRVVKLRGKQADCAACSEAALSPARTLASRASQHPEYVPADCAIGSSYSHALLPTDRCCTPHDFYNEWSQAPSRHLDGVWSICVDVRATNQYDMVRLPHSYSLPLETIQQWARANGGGTEEWAQFITKAIREDMKARGPLCDASDFDVRLCTVFIICRRGVASAQAVKLLLEFTAEVDVCVQLLQGSEYQCAVSLRNVDGGLNAFSKTVDPEFPYY